MSYAEVPLLSPSPFASQRLVEAVEPASLLLVVEQGMNAGLRAGRSAEDVLQEALMPAWNRRTECEWRGIESVRSCLLSIIDDRIFDLAERAGTRWVRDFQMPVAVQRIGTVGANEEREVSANTVVQRQGGEA
jgi:DNA-directed RNA polymerase specialized sigma24 family protein